VAKPVGGGLSLEHGSGGVRRREIDLKDKFSSIILNFFSAF
jgi:hypothetical protein